MTFYLVGPSGAGKTTLASALETQALVQFVDSDDALGVAAGHWESVLERLNTWEAKNDELLLLVAIGAGTQDIDRNHPQRPLWNWLSARRENVLAIMCTPEEVLSRRSQFHDTQDSVRQTEFATARLHLYETARYSIVTSGLAELEAAIELKHALKIEAESRPSDLSASREPQPV